MSDPIPDVSTGEVQTHSALALVTLPTKMREGEVITIRGDVHFHSIDCGRLPIGEPGQILKVRDGAWKWVDPAEEAAKREVEEFLGPLP